MEPTEPTPHGTGPTLFYAMLGLILTLLLSFLVLRPRGAKGQTPDQPTDHRSGQTYTAPASTP